MNSNSDKTTRQQPPLNGILRDIGIKLPVCKGVLKTNTTRTITINWLTHQQLTRTIDIYCFYSLTTIFFSAPDSILISLQSSSHIIIDKTNLFTTALLSFTTDDAAQDQILNAFMSETEGFYSRMVEAGSPKQQKERLHKTVLKLTRVTIGVFRSQVVHSLN